MEKNNGKIIAIVALVVAVVALSVGFAAFTDSLTIAGNATVTGGDNSLFAGSFGYASSPAAACVYTGGSTTAANTNAGSASGNSWSGISITLNDTNPSVTCTATIENTSAYDASLTSFSSDTNVGCTSSTATNASAICATVQEVVTIDTNSTILTVTPSSSSSGVTGTLGGLTIPKQVGTKVVSVTVSYDKTAGVPDGDITITLPTITHGYTTVSGS